MIVAFACPPPSHMVCRPYRPPVRSSSCSNLVIRIAPVAPSGWPSAIAPPFGLVLLNDAPVSLDQATIEGVEAAFSETFPGAGPAAPVTPIATSKTNNGAGTATLASVGNLFELNPESGGPLLELNGSAVTTSTFATGWTPVGAVQTGTGYEVAFKNNQNQFVVWNTDKNGDYTSNATGVLPATSTSTLAGLEAAFGNEDFAGLTPATPSPIGIPTPNGQLALVGDLYELGSEGPLLEEGGVAVTAGSLGGWTPVGAEQTATGYEVVWSLFNNGESQDTYTVWNTDSGGNYTSSALGLVSGQNFSLEDLNPVFGENVSGAPVCRPLCSPPQQARTARSTSVRRRRTPRSISATTPPSPAMA